MLFRTSLWSRVIVLQLVSQLIRQSPAKPLIQLRWICRTKLHRERRSTWRSKKWELKFNCIFHLICSPWFLISMFVFFCRSDSKEPNPRHSNQITSFNRYQIVILTTTTCITLFYQTHFFSLSYVHCFYFIIVCSKLLVSPILFYAIA